MKQRIKIKQYRKELNKAIDFATNSFEWDLKHSDTLETEVIKIWHEYFQDLENLSKILKNKQLHTIQKIKNEDDLVVYSFSDLLDDIDAMYEVAFDDKEIYNFSNLLRKPILKPVKQNKRKQYKKALNHILCFYKKRIKAIKGTLAYINLVIDLNVINTLIQQNRIKELNIILDDMPFNGFVDDLIYWYLEEWDDKVNTIIYDYELRKIKL